jgi:hypothetical protein
VKSIQKTYLSFLIYTFLLCVNGFVASAQVKVGTTTSSPNPNAMLEIESTNKGLLLPRLALVSTNSPAPLTAFVKGMVVYDTATTNDVTPGIYYSDGTQWVRVGNGIGTGNVSNGVLKKYYLVLANGQAVFGTPAAISDPDKIMLYRNGIAIGFTVASPTAIQSEIACNQFDEIRIVQTL